MATRLLSDRDWAQLRDVRLRALRESPMAFLSTYEEQVRWTDSDWKTEASRGEWLVEVSGTETVALLGATPESDVAESDRYLSFLWVAADQRDRGIAQNLVRTMLSRLRDQGVARAWLWVLGENAAARNLYERLGFVGTGERQPLKKDPARYEERMTLPLR